MEAEQIKIADEIISNLQKFRGTLTWDDCVEKLSTFPPKLPTDIMLVYERLKQQDLFVINEKNDLMLITAKGEKAAGKGYAEYVKYLEKKEADKEAKDHRDAVMSKWQIIAFWPTFIYATIGATLGIIAFFWQLLE